MQREYAQKLAQARRTPLSGSTSSYGECFALPLRFRQMKSSNVPLEESVDALRRGIEDEAKKAASAKQFHEAAKKTSKNWSQTG